MFVGSASTDSASVAGIGIMAESIEAGWGEEDGGAYASVDDGIVWGVVFSATFGFLCVGVGSTAGGAAAAGADAEAGGADVGSAAAAAAVGGRAVPLMADPICHAGVSRSMRADDDATHTIDATRLDSMRCDGLG